MMQKIIPYKGNEPYIFISYAHRDGVEVRSVLERMQRDGYRVWFDEGIDPGTEWDEVIASHVEACEYFIAFISENYLASDNCKDELNYARDLSKKRLLVFLQDVKLPGGMAMRLNRLQSIYKNRYENDADFYATLYAAEGLSSFASAEGLSTEMVEEETRPQPIPVLVPEIVFAEESSAQAPLKAEEVWEFFLDDEGGGFAVDGADNCADTDIEIPASYQVMPVTGIDGHAFWNCTELISVTVPDTVTSIGNFAFEGCVKLSTLRFGGTTHEWRCVKKGKGWNKGTPKKLKVICAGGIFAK